MGTSQQEERLGQIEHKVSESHGLVRCEQWQHFGGNGYIAGFNPVAAGEKARLVYIVPSTGYVRIFALVEAFAAD